MGILLVPLSRCNDEVVEITGDTRNRFSELVDSTLLLAGQSIGDDVTAAIGLGTLWRPLRH